jgi:hypothetical protein
VERDLRARSLCQPCRLIVSAFGDLFGIVFKEADPPMTLSRTFIFDSKCPEHRKNKIIVTLSIELA